MAYAFGCAPPPSARLLIISEGFGFFLSAEAVSLLFRASGAYTQQTSLTADGDEYIWALWVSASSSLGLCQRLCMEACGTLWCAKGSPWDACTLLQVRCHLLRKAALWVSHSWDLGKGSIAGIHFQPAKMDRGIVQKGARGHKDMGPCKGGEGNSRWCSISEGDDLLVWIPPSDYSTLRRLSTSRRYPGKKTLQPTEAAKTQGDSPWRTQGD